jgi:uncharacterized protein GlcG (DUF336 family)
MPVRTPLLLAALAAAALARAQSPAASSSPAPASVAAASAPQPPARGLPADLALEAATTALATCRGLDQRVGVSVLDSGGQLRLLLAADGASDRGVQNSTLKARAALAFNLPSGEVAERAKSDAAVAERLAANPGWLARAGAIPVVVDGALVGAIGVGGARGSDKDEACAVAALERVRARLR